MGNSQVIDFGTELKKKWFNGIMFEEIWPFICDSIENIINPRQKHEMHFINATPDSGYIKRILESYIDETYWSDNTLGMPPENPLCIEMNKAREQRNVLLKEAIRKITPVNYLDVDEFYKDE
jgi:hypothetical protein